MNVNIEFFDKEPIENLITCLNFKMDKMIFFGNSDVMTFEAKEKTRKSCLSICKISDVDFIELSRTNIEGTLSVLSETIENEEKHGGKCFFDLTGGDEMTLAAIGLYAANHNTPMHRFDVPSNELVILNTGADRIDECVEKHTIKLTLDDFIGINGGVIDYSLQKSSKENLDNREFADTVSSLWEIAKRDMRKWNGFSMVLNSCKSSVSEFLYETLYIDSLICAVSETACINNVADFTDMLYSLKECRAISGLTAGTDKIEFRYKNPPTKECLLDAGCVLELHTYYDRLQTEGYDDCRIGVHLKWDYNTRDLGFNVCNEIDVLLLRGYIPVFISCKGGHVDQSALYELDTVASRFGGKYAKKELVTMQPIVEQHLFRAHEMNISVKKA